MPRTSPPPPSPELVARDVVALGVAPDAATGCAARQDGVWRVELGGDCARFFDLASLTKPMTAVAAALLASGALGPRIDRGAPLRLFCPELGDTESAETPLELLLAHRGGLLGHIKIFEPLVTGGAVDAREALRMAANARREECRGPCPAQGFPPVYSDLGYALAGEALARQAGFVDAGALIGALVVERLELQGALGTARDLAGVGVELDRVAAPTEHVPWRGGLVRGRVHDENAWALTGRGGSGHAGMFGTAFAVVRFGQAVLDGLEGRGPFAAAELEWLVVPRPGGTLRAGFDGKSAEGSSAGDRFGPRSFGHLGFTGTSLWIDPDARIVAVLLTNRVCPSRANEALRPVRPWAHDALHTYAAGLAAHVRQGG